MPKFATILAIVITCPLISASARAAADEPKKIAFFEKKIRPLLAKNCYQCHSQSAKKKRGGLLLDRKSGWLEGGRTGKAVVPGNPDASLLIKMVRSKDELKMPPDNPLEADDIRLLETWVRLGAPAPDDDADDPETAYLGDQKYLFAKAETHWAFQPVAAVKPPASSNAQWNRHAIDKFIFAALTKNKLTPSKTADARTLIRRLTFDLTGLPATPEEVNKFITESKSNPTAAIEKAVDQLITSPAFGEHFARMWLDVARYADTDSFYRPDTRTPHYFPFAFTYRDYVIDAFNADKPYAQFIREQLAADLMDFESNAPQMAALGFFTVGPHANRNQAEAIDDWIDVTTRGLMGMTVACARCHDHKFEPIPTTDYYSLRGVFASMVRVHPLDEERQPLLDGYEIDEKDRKDYERKRAKIDAKLKAAKGKKAKNNNRPLVQKIRETELAQLLSFHPGAPVRTMIVKQRNRPAESFVFLRGDPRNRGDRVPRRFLKVLDPQQKPFPEDTGGRLELADKIIDPSNPLTARVFVNRVWGNLMGSHLVDTPSNFGLKGSPPTHPELLDWLAADFVKNGWSLKHLVRNIVLSRTYQQSSAHREEMSAIDPTNKYLWRANCKRLSIEALRDSMLAVAGKLDRTPRGRPAPLWGKDYTRRRTIYGYINRFNLDPILRTFDYPAPMATHAVRPESIVPTQALFALNAPFVIDQAIALTESDTVKGSDTDAERVRALFQAVFQRDANDAEVNRVMQFVREQGESAWPLAAQALLMSNEFQYVD